MNTDVVSAPPVAEIEPAARRPGVVDAVIAIGFAVAIWASSIDLTIVGIDDFPPTDGRMQLIQRLSVYSALTAALIARVPVIELLRRPAVAVFFVFASWTVLGSLFTDSPGAEFERAVWFFGYALLTLAVFARFGWQRFLGILAFVAAMLVVGGLVAHLGGWATADKTEFFDGGLFGYERVRGLQPTANSLGRAGAFLALISTILMIRVVAWTGRFAALLGMTAGVGGVLASQSRFSILGLAIGVAIVCCRHWRWTRIPTVIALAAGTGAGLFVLLTGTLGPFSRASDSDELATVLGRTQVWEESLDLVVANPLFGVGTEGMLEHFDRLQSGGYAFWDPENGHNLLIHTAAAHGVFASALVFSAVTVGLLQAWRWGQSGSAALVSMFVAIGVVEALMIGSPTVALAALIGALGASAGPDPPSA